ncbi:TRIM3 [Branchiostoma lanceolatum]|uniref:TRIM3 protein n=1 Tax=Branchiostoma lanceolatum TaxID=7740 RepID=A0A8K0A7V0_BRALA|nr:TRIM3 [Branchiostoma lanceolatum]
MLQRVLQMTGSHGARSSEWGREMATLGAVSSDNRAKDGDDDGRRRSAALDHSLPAEFNFLLCRLCYRRLHNPRILYCWHTFCLRCISRHLGSENQLSCPLCRIITRVPKIGLDALYHRAAEFLSRLSQTCTAISVCDLDLEIRRHHCHQRAKSFRDPARCLLPCTRVCRSCDEYLCEECSPLHLIEMHLSRNSICPQHGEPELSFCEDCREMACGICTELEHMYHDITGLSEKAETYRSEARDLIRKCREGRWKLDDDLQATVQKARAEIQEEAKNVIESLTRTVKEKESKLLGQVDDFAMQMWIKIQEAKQQHGLRTDEHEGLIELGQNLLTCGSNKEIVQIHHHLRHRLTEAVAGQSPQEVPQHLLQQVEFVRHQTQTLDGDKLIGKVSFWDPCAERGKTFRRRSFMPSWLLEESDSEPGGGSEERRKSSGARMMEAIIDMGRKYRGEIERKLSGVSMVSEDSLTSESDSGDSLLESAYRRLSFSKRKSSIDIDTTDEDQTAPADHSTRRQTRSRRFSVPDLGFSVGSFMTSLRNGDQEDTGKGGKAKTRRFSLFSLNRSKKMPKITDDEEETQLVQTQRPPVRTLTKIPPEGIPFHDLNDHSSDSNDDMEPEEEVNEETFSEEDDKEENGEENEEDNEEENEEENEEDGEGQSSYESDSSVKTERKKKKKSRLGRFFKRGRSLSVMRHDDLASSELEESVRAFLHYTKSRRRSMSLPSSLDSGYNESKDIPSSEEDGSRLDPMRWVGKRKEDVRRFRKRFGRIGGSFLKTLKGKEDFEEELVPMKVHPWDVPMSRRSSSTDEEAMPGPQGTPKERRRSFGHRLPVAGFSSTMKTLSEEDGSKDNVKEQTEGMGAPDAKKTGGSESSDEEQNVFDASGRSPRMPGNLSRFQNRRESSGSEEGNVSAPEMSIFHQLPKNRGARARRFSVF